MNATRNFAKVALCSALALGALGTVSSVFADEMPAAKLPASATLSSSARITATKPDGFPGVSSSE